MYNKKIWSKIKNTEIHERSLHSSHLNMNRFNLTIEYFILLRYKNQNLS